MNDKILLDILSGSKDSNIKFRDLQNILKALQFDERVKGDHFIYRKEDVSEIINIQPNGNKAKPYQVKQIRRIILKYRLGGKFL
ncbi:MAG: type II toxin-antitoxin system HicA family toxin [Clostridiales bacterium]|nr:type II toxin-antitoxin system HicA family toxin [Clostridiales bacterium]